MAMTGISAFDRTVQKTNEWLTELMERMDWSDRQTAYRALRATLHALRDRLGPEEAAELGAQLPMLVRGIYYEGWRPAATPVKDRHREEFLYRIATELRGDGELVPTEDVARGVFDLLSSRISAGEMEDVRRVLPTEIRELFA